MSITLTTTESIEPTGVGGLGDVPLKRFTLEEYYRMADLGAFQDMRVELVDGVIIDMAPQNHPHFLAQSLIAEALRAAYGPGHWIRMAGPLNLDHRTAPEPDISVIAGTPRDFSDHPTTALLLVEVSDSTLQYDKLTKARLYASFNLPAYWIIDINARTMLIHSLPVDGKYTSVITLTESQSVTPPGTNNPISLKDILP